LVLIFLQGPIQVDNKPAAPPPPKKDPPKQSSGKSHKVLEFSWFGKDSEPVPYEPKVLSFWSLYNIIYNALFVSFSSLPIPGGFLK